MKLPAPIQRVVDELSDLPSIGPRQAIRLAFFLIGEGKEHIRGLAMSVAELASIKVCARCFFIHQNDGDLCDICKNPHRAQSVIMVVEKETDLISLENTGKFAGRYFIIGEIPKTGMLDDTQKLRLQSLKGFIQRAAPDGLGGKAEEIILGFNPTSLGDFQASLFTKELAPLSKKISRLGRGLPTGGEIEFADDETLGSALERRS
ncbi:MAG TPA: toprim domain-containing protein [Candidatus Paceibacterota bacterium]|jgi:recombination protein RecR|nr:toprim domain-containing protein [Candidatus Paceibacterota bacterium]